MTAPVRIVLAPDKFKGSLRASDVALELAAGLHQVDPGIEVTTVPVADGGDGTLDAALSAGFARVEVDAFGPTGRPRRSAFGVRGDTAVIELAGVCGLMLLGADLDPLGATSYGLGAVLAAALDSGVGRIVVGIGGSASTDGGAGALSALGARLLDADGHELALGGGALADLDRIELDALPARLSDVEVIVARDVDNPLCGPHGAAAVYGPQKGATPAQVVQLDANLAQLAAVVARRTGRDWSTERGAGAAGGVGFGLLVAGAELRPGIDLMLELVGFDAALAGADLVITGEGSLDEQTLAGKAPAGVAAAARAHGVPVVAVAGRSELSVAQLTGAGIDRVFTLSDLEPDPARSIAAAGPLVRRIGALIGAELSSLVNGSSIARGARP
jgi:glycerate 2-kinase